MLGDISFGFVFVMAMRSRKVAQQRSFAAYSLLHTPKFHISTRQVKKYPHERFASSQ